MAEERFLETLVRVHRQGEGAPYTGLKPAGEMAPAFEAADAALVLWLHEDAATTIVLLAGGIGITPFRAMVEDTRNRELKHSITLIHSNRMPEEAPFLWEFTEWTTRSDGFIIHHDDDKNGPERRCDAARHAIQAESLGETCTRRRRTTIPDD